MAIDIVEVTSSGCSNITVTSNNSPSISVSSSVASCGGGSVDTTNLLTTGDAYNLYYPRSNPSGYGTGFNQTSSFSISGTSGYLAKFYNTTGLINSSIYDNNNIGIGTTNPLKFFHVTGESYFQHNLAVTGLGTNIKLVSLNNASLILKKFSPTDLAEIIFAHTGASVGTINSSIAGNFIIQGSNQKATRLIGGVSGTLALIAAEEAVMTFSTNNTERARWTTEGYLGLNNMSPVSLLDVSGHIRGSGGSFIHDLSISGHSVITGDNGASGIISERLYQTGSNLQNQINLLNNLTGEFLFTGNLINYNVFATSGVDTELITYPVLFSNKPVIHVEFENSMDNLTYLHTISGINNNGFYINYSDFLSNSGYKLHITLRR